MPNNPNPFTQSADRNTRVAFGKTIENVTLVPSDITNEKCPWCKIDAYGTYTSMTGSSFMEFACGSRVAEIESKQSDKCRIRELEIQNAALIVVAKAAASVDSWDFEMALGDCSDREDILSSVGFLTDALAAAREAGVDI